MFYVKVSFVFLLSMETLYVKVNRGKNVLCLSELPKKRCMLKVSKAVPSHFAKTKTKLSFAFAFAKYHP
jgi:hypothetical protein